MWIQTLAPLENLLSLTASEEVATFEISNLQIPLPSTVWRSTGLTPFITGNFDEPAWHQAFEENIHFFAMGHSATERVGPQALGQHLVEKFNLDHTFIDIENPF